MFLILCLINSLGVIRIILLKTILNTISQLCHFIPFWVPFLLVVMSNDTERNPGDNKLFTFCNWNLNSLTKDNFSRLNLPEAHNSLFNYDIISLCSTMILYPFVKHLNSLTKDNFIPLNLLEAHNSLFNYDIISLCDTDLNASVDLPSNLLDGFKSIFSHYPSGNKRGGVALFYKANLPLVERNDLSFNECIVTEIHIGRKKVFFTVYRSPNDKAGSPEFDRFLNELDNLYTKIKYENPCATFFTCDFNAHSHNWWSEGDTNNEGIAIDNLQTALDLNQIICEPTHFEENKNLNGTNT